MFIVSISVVYIQYPLGFCLNVKTVRIFPGRGIPIMKIDGRQNCESSVRSQSMAWGWYYFVCIAINIDSVQILLKSKPMFVYFGWFHWLAVYVSENFHGNPLAMYGYSYILKVIQYYQPL